MSTGNNDPSDLDKLRDALASITSISSTDDVLAAFGLLDMPAAQKYGIMFGFLTFALTVGAVLALLTLGGSWKRIEEQARSGESVSAPDAVTQRKRRALLLERLLEMREWMTETNYPEKSNGNDKDEKNGTKSKFSALTRMLMMVTPEEVEQKGKKKIIFPENYEEEYKAAYRRCQDKTGGPILGGRPNHRFEAYARAFASCGTRTSLPYRWSYSRMYESLAGKSHESDDHYSTLFQKRPRDIIGRTVRLEALEEDRHLNNLWETTSGKPFKENKAYNPDEVWGFLDYGPFPNAKFMLESPVFQLQHDQAAFAIIESVTDRILGVIHLTKDDPKNLNIQMELPIIKPTSEGTVEQIEACFLLLDRLFAFGYRRVQLCVDTQDVVGKRLPQRLGFTQEGQIPKHMIVKEANRDSIIYGMLNSDWDKGARAFLFKKLHGAAAQKTDAAIVAKEQAVEEQAEQLKEKKLAEEKANDGENDVKN
mmetsp:Transcript_15568/g.31689  ORF Transcript_15568/g.31689 Transcript_15568/m.31689 type:complete len:480 (-) Transcript_15568:240-1679(-)